MAPIDLTFRLTDDERSQLLPHLDHDAVERYLQHIPAESRPSVLRMFMNRSAVLTGIHPSFPDEQELLDEIYGLRERKKLDGPSE